mgnify:CR=1 FL=1
MISYDKLIQKNFTNKFQNSTVFDKNLLNSFFIQRKKLFGKIEFIKISKDKNDNDDTLEKIKSLYYRKNYNSNIVLQFYKKFEVNLCLKKRYNNNFKKTTNIDTLLSTYAYLGICILNNNSLNLLQKINCIIKIIDKISINFFPIDPEAIKVVKILIKKEHLLIKKMIQ